MREDTGTRTFVVYASPLSVSSAEAPKPHVDGPDHTHHPVGCFMVDDQNAHVCIRAGSAAEAVLLASRQLGIRADGESVSAGAPDAREATALVMEIAREVAYLQERLQDLQEEIRAIA